MSTFYSDWWECTDGRNWGVGHEESCTKIYYGFTNQNLPGLIYHQDLLRTYYRFNHIDHEFTRTFHTDYPKICLLIIYPDITMVLYVFTQIFDGFKGPTTLEEAIFSHKLLWLYSGFYYYPPSLFYLNSQIRMNKSITANMIYLRF